MAYITLRFCASVTKLCEFGYGKVKRQPEGRPTISVAPGLGSGMAPIGNHHANAIKPNKLLTIFLAIYRMRARLTATLGY